MISFQYYENKINNSIPKGFVTIDQFIKANLNPKPNIIELFNKIQQCDEAGDKEGKARLKEGLYSFTPCVNVSYTRSYKNILNWTGLLVLDFDKINNAQDFKQFLIDEYDFIHACWISPSKKGVKAFVQIPICSNVDEFKSYYFGIAEEMEQYNGFDPSGQNCVLPLFQSMDREIYYNPFSFKWMHKGFKKSNFVTTSPIEVKYTGEKQESVIIKIINTGINKIVDNGHPQLRSLCMAAGGYVGNGYIDFQTALNQIFYCIDTNGYLKKGIAGYKKTAKQFLELGTTKPLSL